MDPSFNPLDSEPRRNPAAQLLLAFVLLAGSLLWGAWQTGMPPPAQAFALGDLKTLQGWVDPVAVAPGKGRTTVVGDPVLRAFHFVDAQTGWAVGKDGLVLATRDGGAHWHRQTTPTSAMLAAVHFVNSRQGWAVGESGQIVATRDGGASWQLQPSGIDLALNAVFFADELHGCAMGNNGSVLTTDDGGTHWAPQKSVDTLALTAMHFTNPQLGWAVGWNGAIFATRNGGADWQTQASATPMRLNSVYFADDQRGWAAGEAGTILATSDGGAHWQVQLSGVQEGLNAIHFANSMVGWAVGWGGTILRTRDGGKQWVVQSLGPLVGLEGVQFVSPTQGWVLNQDGSLWHSTDGGLHWQAQSAVVETGLMGVHFASVLQGWVVGWGGVILATRDGGQTWQGQYAGGTERLNSVYFLDSQSGWAVGWNGSILATRNGGTDWQPQVSTTPVHLNAVFFASPVRGYAAGQLGTILATRDGGVHWEVQKTGVDKELLALHFVSAVRGWAVGAEGTILSTRDGGAHWLAENDAGPTLVGLHFSTPAEGRALGQGRVDLVTHDGGGHWQTQLADRYRTSTAWYFAGPLLAWVVGGDGNIWSSTDGGEHWQPQNLGGTDWLTAVHFATPNLGWAVSSDGNVLSTRDGGLHWKTSRPPRSAWLNAAYGSRSYALWPSPAAVVLMLYSLFWLPRALLAWQRSRHLNLAAGGISDAPITAAAQDRLQRLPVARTLAMLVRNLSSKPPLAISVTARWGEGKSSVLGLLQDELRGDARCVWLNAWHYREDGQLLAALMEHVCDQALPPALSMANLEFRCKLMWLRLLKPHWRWWALVLPAACSVPLLWPAQWQWARAMVGQWDMHSPLWAVDATLQALTGDQRLVPEWLRTLLASSVLITAVWQGGKRVLSAAAAFSPLLTHAAKASAQAASAALSVPDWSRDAGMRHRFASDFRTLAQSLGRGKLVLLIDDLDRCEPKQVESVMATLNFIFSTPAPCYAVLAMDVDYVLAALGLAYKDMALAMDPQDSNGQRFARRYLGKIVQLRVDLGQSQGSALLLKAAPRPAPAVPHARLVASVCGRLAQRARAAALRWLLMACRGISRPPRVRDLGSWLHAMVLGLQVMGRWLGELFQTVLKELVHAAVRVRAWQWALGMNVVGVLLASGLSAALVLLVAPTIVQPFVKTPMAVKLAPTPTPPAMVKSLSGAPASQTQGSPFPQGTVEVQEAATNPAPLRIQLMLLVWLALTLLLVSIQLQRQVTDRASFTRALAIWQVLLQAHLGTPRDWRRLHNAARLLAMRVRVAQWQPWYLRLAQWWQVQAQQAGVVATVPAPPPALDEGLAAELMLFDVVAHGAVYAALSQWLLAGADAVASTCALSVERYFGPEYGPLIPAAQAARQTFTEVVQGQSAIPRFMEQLKVQDADSLHQLRLWLMVYSELRQSFT